MQSEAFWITAPRSGEIRKLDLPPRGPDDVLVRTQYSAISRGTESLVWQGRVPESEYGRMRAPFQQGDFPFPVKYGYCNVGLVEQGPPDLLGQVVFCLYPHQRRYVVPAAAVTPIPTGIPPERAVLCANLETAVNALWDAAPRIGDRVSVVGAGLVGSLVAWLAAGITGTEVELVDINADRAAVAQRLGARFALPDAASRERDIVIHASASEAGLATSLALAGTEASVIELSWYGDRSIPVPLGQAFHAKRLQLRASQVGMISPHQRARWNHRRRLALVMRLLQADVLDTLVTGSSDFTELPAIMDTLSMTGRDVLCHRITYTR